MSRTELALGNAQVCEQHPSTSRSTHYAPCHAPNRARFGPARASEVMPLAHQWIKPGGDFFSDGLKCYKDLESFGTKVYQVSHKNEFCREQGNKKVHSQTIDGLWGVIKNRFRGKFGVHDLPSHIDEFVWRRQHRLSPNLFLDMLDLCKIQPPLSS
uniref:ISXO2-like transposase domain-containing protein n=1 Tax=Eutreptiella gymnastica TaxID=73025 RepID=A0A7S1JH03_9EUGL|mmetsp:Transcript_95899/g.165285  ORF Transcript_95899/g.165285 Transcript_95899/m.165285 type:complete len:156 (+) Transcript_95899:139-606(+)